MLNVYYRVPHNICSLNFLETEPLNSTGELSRWMKIFLGFFYIGEKTEASISIVNRRPKA